MTIEKRPAETERDQQLTTRVEFQNEWKTRTIRSRGEWERIMRKSVVLVAATMLIAAAAAFTTPAAATDTRTAVRLCDQNPNCTYSGDPGGGMQIFVKTSQGDKVIDCPNDAEAAKGAQCAVIKRVITRDTVGVVGALNNQFQVAPAAPGSFQPSKERARPRGVEGEPATSAPAGQEEKAPAPK